MKQPSVRSSGNTPSGRREGVTHSRRGRRRIREKKKKKKFRELTYSGLRVDKCHETRHRSLPYSPPPPPLHRIPSSLRRPTRFNEPGMMTWYCHVGNLLSDSSGCPTTPLRFLCIAARPALRSSFFSSFPIPTGEDRLGARGRWRTTWRRVVDRLCVRACVRAYVRACVRACIFQRYQDTARLIRRWRILGSSNFLPFLFLFWNLKTEEREGEVLLLF